MFTVLEYAEDSIAPYVIQLFVNVLTNIVKYSSTL